MDTTKGVVDMIGVKESGQIEVRQKRIIEKNGKEVPAYHRFVLSPGDDLEGQHPEVIAAANKAWTPGVIAAYQDSLQNRADG